MDACLQVLAATHQDTSGRYRYLPIGCSCIRFFSKPSPRLWSWVYRHPESESGKDQIRADIRIFNTDNILVAEFIGLLFQRVGQSSNRRLKPTDIWLYRLDWKLQYLPQVSITNKKDKRTWLIFADHTELGETLVKKLEEQGDTCHVFRIDDIQKTRPKELSHLISKFVGEITSPIYGIVHLWGLSIPPAPNVDFDQMDIYGSNSILYLVQALAGRLAGSPSLWLVTQGAQSVMEAESISVAQSAILGLGKVISFEFPELKCIRVDLDPNGLLKDSLPLLFEQINTESREDQIAYRAGKRFVLRLLPYSTGGTTAKQHLDVGPDRTYLITGGMGALGLETAKWLVRKGARHLVLLGRSGPTTLAEKAIHQMREEGCEVYLARADVSSRNQLKKVFQHIDKEMPLLSGIIHSAGVLDDGSLLNLDHARMKIVTNPKIEGAWYLHELSLPYSLDFFVLYSSAVSVLGSPGQGNYSAASAYLDALAHYRHRLNLSGMSINWGPWADIGLAAETSERLREQNVVQQHLIKEISIEQGLETLELLMYEANPQVVVLPFDLKNLIELYPTAASMPFLAEVGGSDTHVSRLYARPKLPQQYIAPRNDIERKLAELWRNTLHIDRVGVQDSFFELGGDSVLASQILSLAQKNFGIRINPQEAFKAFTIERLAEMLEAEIIRKIEAMSEEEVQEKLSQKD
jgi:NADP-dependent 3-hydroxy acid dehydrogenase YdfG/acyl carrier protein